MSLTIKKGLLELDETVEYTDSNVEDDPMAPTQNDIVLEQEL